MPQNVAATDEKGEGQRIGKKNWAWRRLEQGQSETGIGKGRTIRGKEENTKILKKMEEEWEKFE